MGIEIKMIIIMMFIMAGMLGMIVRELRRIERKLEHPDDKPKHYRFWGNGKR